MNTSSNTKTNLTINGVVTGNPFVGMGVFGVLFVLITVTVFGLLVKLGLWQLERAEYKHAWQTTLAERQQQGALDYDALQTLIINNQQNEEISQLTGYRLSVKAKPALSQIFLLDNQVYQGQVGYLAYQVFEVSKNDPWLLVELGFVAADKDRRILPTLTPIEYSHYTLVGRIYQKQANPLSDKLLAEKGSPIRFQNLNLTELAELVDHPISPVVLQPDNVPEYSLPQPWQPIPLSAQKHQGYALQWFTMAAVFLGLMTWLTYRRFKR